SLGAVLICLLAGCSNTLPPPVTGDMIRASSTGNVAVAQLQHGRSLFASRCIECHTLPLVAAHSDSEWPHLIDAMATRASLRPAEREAVLAYVLAARTLSR